MLGLEASGPAALAVHWNDGALGTVDLAPALPAALPAACGFAPTPIETTARL